MKAAAKPAAVARVQDDQFLAARPHRDVPAVGRHLDAPEPRDRLQRPVALAPPLGVAADQRPGLKDGPAKALTIRLRPRRMACC
jgi:hypothetical protein